MVLLCLWEREGVGKDTFSENRNVSSDCVQVSHVHFGAQEGNDNCKHLTWP